METFNVRALLMKETREGSLEQVLAQENIVVVAKNSFEKRMFGFLIVSTFHTENGMLHALRKTAKRRDENWASHTY